MNHGATLGGDLGVGTLGGSQDHTAILCSRPGELRQYGFCPVRFERSVPFPAGHKLVIGVSGIAAEKTGASSILLQPHLAGGPRHTPALERGHRTVRPDPGGGGAQRPRGCCADAVCNPGPGRGPR